MKKERKDGRPTGEFVQGAKYLGNWTNIKERSRVNTNHRIKATREGFYAYQHFGSNKEVPLKANITVFRSNLISARTTGLEAEVLNNADCKS